MAGKPGDGDKRSVSTDALETLGYIIDDAQKRDAIHLAVDPVVATEDLEPGQHCSLMFGSGHLYGAAGHSGKTKDTVGIVDPFLERGPRKGERFWLVMYPRMISSLRHVWTHPAFPDEPGVHAIEPPPVDPRVRTSTLWIGQFAMDIGISYYALMDAAEDFVESGTYTYENTETYKEHWEKFPEFWDHYEIVTGKKLDPDEDRGNFFTCSC